LPVDFSSSLSGALVTSNDADFPYPIGDIVRFLYKIPKLVAREVRSTTA